MACRNVASEPDWPISHIPISPDSHDLAHKQDKHTIWALQTEHGGRQRLSLSGGTQVLNEWRHRQSRNRNVESQGSLLL
jgi:hypothetical protein